MKLHIGNLSKDVTKAELRELATPYGTLLTLKIAVDPTSGEAKGFGFVEYSGIEEGMAAMAGLDGRDLRGMALAVTEAKPKARIPSPSDR